MARHRGIEERPDPIVGGDDHVDLRSKVMCGAGHKDVVLGVVGAVEQEAVLHNEVGQELVRGESSRGGIDHTSFGASAGDERIHGFATRGSLCLAASEH